MPEVLATLTSIRVEPDSARVYGVRSHQGRVRRIEEPDPNPFKQDELRQDYSTKLEQIKTQFPPEELEIYASFEHELRKYFPEDHLDQSKAAYTYYWMALRMRDLPLRDDGSTAESHSRKVTQTVILLSGGTKLACDVICGTLAHDTEEDCPEVTFELIEQEFGKRVRILVEGVSKLRGKHVDGLPEEEQDALTMELVFKGMAIDPGIALIKGADRIVVMDLDGMKDKLNKDGSIKKPADQRRRDKATETEWYVEFFRQLGIYHHQLAEKVVKYFYPSDHSKIDEMMHERIYNLTNVQTEMDSFLRQLYQSKYQNPVVRTVFNLLGATFDSMLPVRFVSVRDPDYLEIKERLDNSETTAVQATAPIVKLEYRHPIQAILINELLRRWNPSLGIFHRSPVQTFKPEGTHDGVIIRQFEYEPNKFVEIHSNPEGQLVGNIYLPELAQRRHNSHSSVMVEAVRQYYASFFSQRLGDRAIDRRPNLIESFAAHRTKTIWIREGGTDRRPEYKAVVVARGATVLDVMCRRWEDEEVVRVSRVYSVFKKDGKNIEYSDYEQILPHNSYIYVEHDIETHPDYYPEEGYLERHRHQPTRDFATRRVREIMNVNLNYAERMLPYIRQTGLSRMTGAIHQLLPYLSEDQVASTVTKLSTIAGIEIDRYLVDLALCTSSELIDALNKLRTELKDRVVGVCFSPLNATASDEPYTRFSVLKETAARFAVPLVLSYTEKDGHTQITGALCFSTDFPEDEREVITGLIQK